jgi:hypothetical protein
MEAEKRTLMEVKLYEKLGKEARRANGNEGR